MDILPEKTDTFVIGFLITLLFFTFSTLFTMEVERIWIFMAPFFVIPVAKYLSTRPRSDLYWVACLLVCTTYFVRSPPLHILVINKNADSLCH